MSNYIDGNSADLAVIGDNGSHNDVVPEHLTLAAVVCNIGSADIGKAQSELVGQRVTVTVALRLSWFDRRAEDGKVDRGNTDDRWLGYSIGKRITRTGVTSASHRSCGKEKQHSYKYCCCNLHFLFIIEK